MQGCIKQVTTILFAFTSHTIIVQYPYCSNWLYNYRLESQSSTHSQSNDTKQSCRHCCIHIFSNKRNSKLQIIVAQIKQNHFHTDGTNQTNKNNLATNRAAFSSTNYHTC